MTRAETLEWAFGLDLQAGPKIVLVALATLAEHEAEGSVCYVTAPSLSRFLGLRKSRYVWWQIGKLQDAGLVRTQHNGERVGWRLLVGASGRRTSNASESGGLDPSTDVGAFAREAGACRAGGATVFA